MKLVSSTTNSRKSDIENERLPPELFDADSEEGKAILSSQPNTPPESVVLPPPISPNGVAEGLEKVISSKSQPLSRISTSSGSPSPPGPALGSPVAASPGGFKRGHSRQASLGTTMTSPSTRRRSIESTMSLIQGVLDGNGKIDEDDSGVNTLTNRMTSASVGPSSSSSSSTTGRTGRPAGR